MPAMSLNVDRRYQYFDGPAEQLVQFVSEHAQQRLVCEDDFAAGVDYQDPGRRCVHREAEQFSPKVLHCHRLPRDPPNAATCRLRLLVTGRLRAEAGDT